MDAVSNDLMKPLGVDRPQPRGWRWVRSSGIRLLGGVLLGAGAVGLYAIHVGDPVGGEPYALVPIERARPSRPADAIAPMRENEDRSAASETPSAGQPRPGDIRDRASASEVEAHSGVSVVRPGGGSAPGAVLIQVPEEPSGRPSASNERLLERSRYGLLPRIGTDGARPVRVYARPPGTLPGGAPVAGRVAVVVAGLGVSPTASAEAVAKLPPAVTLAFMPYGGDLERQVAEAREAGHEILLQAPMEPYDYPDNDPGPHTLTVRAKPQENLGHLHWALGRFTGYVGLVNFMGGKFVVEEAALAPLLREIGARGLGVVDDGTTARSQLAELAAAAGAPAARADVVLDAVPRPEAIDRQLARLEQLARQRGFALASASALPVTVDRIAAWASALAARGILLVPVSSGLSAEERR